MNEFYRALGWSLYLSNEDLSKYWFIIRIIRSTSLTHDSGPMYFCIFSFPLFARSRMFIQTHTNVS